ncbi:MAG: hypothetical protein R3199_03720 [Gemmatimonadota bacterium]|nr:hypothetical protein [Gemmatimonadota bacterium]
MVEPVWHLAYRAAREGCALFPRPDDALVEVSGPERLPYLNDLVTNKVDGLRPGEAVRAFLLNPTKGRTVADFLVAEAGETAWLECRGGSKETVLEQLEKYYFGQEVGFHDRSGERAIFSLQGPAAPEILTGLIPDVPPAAEGEHETAFIGSTECRVVRWDDTGSGGYRIWIPAEEADAIRAVLEEAGVVPGHEVAWTVLQIEAGIPAFGRELTEEIIPLEAPTGNAIDHEKGCYPGQEVIARLWARGRPAKELRGLRVVSGEAPAPGTVLDAPDKESAATVTASGTSPELGGVALAYVHRSCLEEGTPLTGEGVAAEVADLPLREPPAGS